jgi:predicted secreted protein
MNFLKISSAFVMLVFCFTMVSGAFAASNDQATVTCPNPLFPAHKTEYLNVKVNDDFEIGMYSNPTTGYTWMEPNYDSEFVTLTSSQYIPYVVPKGTCGSGGDQIYTFKAIKAGDTEILMNYKRPWENCIGELVLYKVHITE